MRCFAAAALSRAHGWQGFSSSWPGERDADEKNGGMV